MIPRRLFGQALGAWLSIVIVTAASAFGALAQTPVLRNPDVRVDTSRGYYSSSTAKLPRLALQGNRAYAVYLDSRYLAAAEPFFNISVNQGGTWNTNDRRINSELPGAFEGDKSGVYVQTGGDSYVYVLMLGILPATAPQARISADAGETFPNAAVDLALDATNDTIERTGFTMAAAAGGKAYVAWSDDRNTDPNTAIVDYSLFLRRTTNGGADNWLKPAAEQQINIVDVIPDPQPPDGPPGENSTDPASCATGSRVYVTWVDRRDTDPHNYPTIPGRILLRYSTNSGTTFQPIGAETRLDKDDTGIETESQVPDIACNASNLVAVVWEDNRSMATADWDIYANVSTNGGVTWRTHEVLVSAGRPPGFAARNPKVAAGSGASGPIYVAWEDNRNGVTDILFSRSTDSGSTWSTPVMVNTPTTATAWPATSWDLSADGTTVVVVWSDNRNGTLTSLEEDIFSVRSTDGGATFGPVERLDLGTGPGAADSNQVDAAVSGGSFVTVFADYRFDPSAAAIFSGGYGMTFDPLDADADGVPKAADNCPDYPNADQKDSDGDGVGDLCDNFPDDPDNDRDGDGVAAGQDNCPEVFNPYDIYTGLQADADADGWGDACDLCPTYADLWQTDLDGDGTGDDCDPDIDGDGTPNASDPDNDNDGIPDQAPDPNRICAFVAQPAGKDNCPCTPNKRQLDKNNNRIGDDCDPADLMISGVHLQDDAPNPTRMTWDKETGSLTGVDPTIRYNVYFKAVDAAHPNRPYMCHAAGVNYYAEHLTETPAVGQQFWFVVTANNATTHGSPGPTDGTERWTPTCERSGSCPNGRPPCNTTVAQDWDGDGVLNVRDNCPFDANASQSDRDKDGLGDVCDPFPGDPQNDALDHDGVGGDVDNCPFVANPSQSDRDGDGVGDACDNCPNVYNPMQEDSNHNGIGDACDPANAGPDIDHDGVPNATDNCRYTYNPSQADTNHDGTGDACDPNGGEIIGVTLRRENPDRMHWVKASSASAYSVYQALVTGPNATAPAYSCMTPATPVPYVDVTSPGVAPRQARFYLVTGWFSGVEGTAGRDSSGTQRQVPSGCQ